MDPFVIPAKLELQLEIVEEIIECLLTIRKPTFILEKKLHQLESYVFEIPSQCFYQVFIWQAKLARWWKEYALIQFESEKDDYHDHLQQALLDDNDGDAFEPRTSTPNSSNIVISSGNTNEDDEPDLDQLAFQQELNRSRTPLSSEPKKQRSPLLSTPTSGYSNATLCYRTGSGGYIPAFKPVQKVRFREVKNEQVSVCNYCRQEGHFKDNCEKLKKTRCKKCSKLGHTAKWCNQKK